MPDITLLKLISIVILLFFCSCKNELPEIKIYSEHPISWTKKMPCKICYQCKNDKICLDSKIKNRGGVSTRYYKHSFTFKLPGHFSLCDLPADNDWILNANYIDVRVYKTIYCFFDLNEE